jgi:hypothetical protein
MRKWVLMMFACMLMLAAAPISQAMPLLPAGSLANAAAASGIELVHHRPWHKTIYKGRGKHKGWVRGRGRR